MKEKEIVFCGSYLPKTISEKIEYNSQAANNFQEGIFNELNKRYNVNILTYIGYPVDNIDTLKNAFKKSPALFHLGPVEVGPPITASGHALFTASAA